MMNAGNTRNDKSYLEILLKEPRKYICFSWKFDMKQIIKACKDLCKKFVIDMIPQKYDKT